jgi:signal transduction histidine kinase
LRNDSSSRTYNDPPGETEAGNEVTVGAEDVVLAVRDYGRGIPEDIETYLAETVLEYG